MFALRTVTSALTVRQGHSRSGRILTSGRKLPNTPPHQVFMNIYNGIKLAAGHQPHHVRIKHNPFIASDFLGE
jgi:hypothetical protein